jgi:hypothetical protein
MPPSQVVFHRLAAREYRSARDWYSTRSAEAAEGFRIGVDRAVHRVMVDAEALPHLVGAYRYVRVSGFPYLLVLRRIDVKSVKVVAVAHASRRPGYWRGRK